MQVHFGQNKSSLATQTHHTNLTSLSHTNLDGQPATRGRLTQNISTFAKRKPNPNFIHFYCTNLDSQHASRVRLLRFSEHLLKTMIL